MILNVSPESSCVDALRAMKACVEPRFLPVLVLSERAGVDARVSGLRAGADDVIVRPHREEEVLARLEAMLRIKSSQDALEAARADLERLSITDPLTGLFNRRYFQYRLEQEVERARRQGGPVSVLMIDLDHFKRVNDRHGHRAGDEALRMIGDLLVRELRRPDVCTRWGGEEFAVILPGTDESGAAVVAKRLLRAIRASARLSAVRIGVPDGRPETVRVTASLGVAAYPSEAVATPEQLVQRADAAMYRAKEQGRDRVRLASALGGSRSRSAPGVKNMPLGPSPGLVAV